MAGTGSPQFITAALLTDLCVLGYWTQKLNDWKQSSIPFSVSSRKTKIVIQNFKFEFLIICIRLQKLWVEVEVSNKWIGNNLKNHAPEVNTAGLILQWFNNTAKKMVTEVQSMDIGSTNDNSIYRSICADSMYRITESIIISYDTNIDELSQEDYSRNYHQ
ncbi:hypothetical protein Tco_0603146 [Tanacetum coccineum]